MARLNVYRFFATDQGMSAISGCWHSLVFRLKQFSAAYHTHSAGQNNVATGNKIFSTIIYNQNTETAARTHVINGAVADPVERSRGVESKRPIITSMR